MNSIKCPKCGTEIKITEEDYNSIINQVRNEQFEKDVKAYEAITEQRIKAEAQTELLKERERLKGEISSLKEENGKLQSKLENAGTDKELAVSKAEAAKDKVILELNNTIAGKDSEMQLAEQSFEGQLALKDKEIERYKNFKQTLSTKAIGESLEQFCYNEYEKYLSMGCFRTASFGKDNDIRTGSKGDFIFRDYDIDGSESISIMFEMKNEADNTAIKHKNKDFFKELDRDRRDKDCEYAVLVSMLEPDSDTYNQGIVDVSFQSGFEKMYVIRPQFFIPVITLLYNAAQKSLEYKHEVDNLRMQQIDIENFEDALDKYRADFSTKCKFAANQFNNAIEGIEKTIKQLEGIKENLLKCQNHLSLADGKLNEISIKKLCKNNPTMTAMFAALEQ